MRYVTVFCLAIFAFLAMSLPCRAAFISEITEISFDKAVKSAEGLVVVWFYTGSTYSGKMLDDIDKYAQKESPVKILRMDKSLNALSVSRYKIKRSNTFLIFADGDVLGRSTKISDSRELDEFIRHYMEEYRKMLDEEDEQDWKPSKASESAAAPER